MKLSIVVPCYNEAENIPLFMKKFAELIGNRELNVILVNNGSTDNSSEIISSMLAQYLFAKTTLVPVNKGYGYGILQGLHIADGKYIGWTHADMQTDPADVIRAYDQLQSLNWPDNIFIKGNRKNRPLLDRCFTNGMSVFETIYMGKRLTDINAQPNIFPKVFFDTWKNPPYDFALDLYAMYMARERKLKILRFTVSFPKRIHGVSKWNTGFKSKWKFIRRTIDFSRKLKKVGVE